MARVTVGAEGQIRVPADLLASLQLDEGDGVLLSLVEGGLLLTPEPHGVLEATYGLAREIWAAAGGSTAFLRETEESWRA